MPKYVVSATLTDPESANATAINAGLVDELRPAACGFRERWALVSVRRRAAGSSNGLRA